MTIAELIQTLSQYDPDLPVVVKGYEGGFNDVSVTQEITLECNISIIVGREEGGGACHKGENLVKE